MTKKIEDLDLYLSEYRTYKIIEEWKYKANKFILKLQDIFYITPIEILHSPQADSILITYCNDEKSLELVFLVFSVYSNLTIQCVLKNIQDKKIESVLSIKPSIVDYDDPYYERRNHELSINEYNQNIINAIAAFYMI